MNIPPHPAPRRPAPHTPEAILGFDWDDVPVKVSIYPSAAERSPRRGQERARLVLVRHQQAGQALPGLPVLINAFLKLLSRYQILLEEHVG